MLSLLLLPVSKDDRSGSNPEWVDGLSDISGEECHKYLDDLSEVPLLKCEGNGGKGCTNDVVCLVQLHVCRSLFACDAHRIFWIVGVNQVIDAKGSIGCDACGENLFTQAAAIRWRVV